MSKDDKNDDKNGDNKLLYCSFCGKSQQDVKKFIHYSWVKI